jgi:hypothetical protein
MLKIELEREREREDYRDKGRSDWGCTQSADERDSKRTEVNRNCGGARIREASKSKRSKETMREELARADWHDTTEPSDDYDGRWTNHGRTRTARLPGLESGSGAREEANDREEKRAS